MAHRPERRPPVQPRVRLEAGPLERGGAVPGPVQRRGEQNARETPVVTRAGAEIPYGVSSTYEIGRERAHFLKMLKKGMVADEKRWTLKKWRKLRPSGPCWGQDNNPLSKERSTHKRVSSSRLA
jgi:hypothetical protein